MQLLWATVRIAARRLQANRRMAAGLLAGIMVAVAGASSVPVFTAGALQRMLQVELAAVADQKLPAAVRISHFEHAKRATKPDQYFTADAVGTMEALGLIGLPIRPLVRYGALELTRAEPVDRSRLNPDVDRWMALSFLSDLKEHGTITDGRWPAEGKAGDGFYEVAVEEETLDKQELTVGAELRVPVSRSDRLGVRVRVVGAFRRTAPDEAYWFVQVPYDQALFVSEAAFTGGLLREPGAMAGEYTWYYGLQNEAIKMTDVVRLLTGLYELEARMAQALPDTTIFSGPHELLERYLVRAMELQLLLLLLAVPPLAVVAYFLVVTSGMLVDGQRQEIAVLRSRGAGLWQVLLIYVLEGGLLAGLALAGGLPLGLLLARAMGAASGFLQFVDRKQPDLLLPLDFWTYGLTAAALAVLAYAAPAVNAARQSIVSYKTESARRLQRPFWARWFLDMLCLALAAYAYWTLEKRAGVAVTPARSAADIDLMQPLDVLAPALFVTGAGLLLLRVVPLLAALVARLSERRAGAPFYLTMLQLSRAPGSYTPVVLLLTLTVGTGLYSAAAARTLERNTIDRVRYAGGADAVISEAWQYILDTSGTPGEGGGMAEPIVKEIQAPPWHEHYDLPGVIHPARVRTQEVTPLVGGRAQRRGKLMAIDPVDFAEVSWFRRDLAPYHITAYLNLLVQDEEAVLVPPAFLERSKLRPGDRIQLVAENGADVDLVIFGEVPYWPAMYPQEADFFIANLDFVEQRLGLTPPWEVWLKMEDGAGLQPVVDALKARSIVTLRAEDVRQRVIKTRRSPQLNGLLGGLTSGFLLSAGITVLGFWLYAALSLRARVLQFGVLRAMGLSVRQLLTAVALEQVLTVLFGVVAGTGLGLAAARLFVPFLQQGSDAVARTPPFVIVADPADRLRLYLVLLFMLAAGLGGLMAAVSRMRVHEAIKLGEDH